LVLPTRSTGAYCVPVKSKNKRETGTVPLPEEHIADKKKGVGYAGDSVGGEEGQVDLPEVIGLDEQML